MQYFCSGIEMPTNTYKSWELQQKYFTSSPNKHWLSQGYWNCDARFTPDMLLGTPKLPNLRNTCLTGSLPWTSRNFFMLWSLKVLKNKKSDRVSLLRRQGLNRVVLRKWGSAQLGSRGPKTL
jgi:hypothetical protein